LKSLVSIVLINYNGARDLPACLESLRKQDYEKIELVAVDNGSTDGSLEILEGFCADPAVRSEFSAGPPRLLANDRNRGFSPALNQGIAETSGELVMPLNTDIVLEDGFVSALAGIMREVGVGSASGKLIRFPPFETRGSIDSAGHVIFSNRLAENRGEGARGDTAFTDRVEVFGTCGAAAMYSRAMLEDVKVEGEYFDEDFFAFWEDLDIDWRARIRGWRCLYEPSAVGYHRRGGAGYRKSLLVEYHNCKNRYLMVIKNDSARYLLRNLPAILFTELLKAGALLIRCPRALLSLAEVVRLLPRMLKKRRVIQSTRVVPAREMEAWFPPFHYRRWFRRHLLERGAMISEEQLGR
jgi:GT2 family glycosyltransferase